LLPNELSCPYLTNYMILIDLLFDDDDDSTKWKSCQYAVDRCVV